MESLELRIFREVARTKNISRAAEQMQIKRQTLQHKMRKYNIMGR